MKETTLIVVCGWPFSGKTTLAENLKTALNVHHIDIDEVRWLMVGKPYPHPNESPELMKKDGQEMGMAYSLLITKTNENLAVGRSLIITATFSRKMGQQMITDLMEKHQQAKLKIIQCIPKGDTTEEIALRMAKRDFGDSGYKGAVNSPERYLEVKERYEKIELPHLTLETWGANTPETCVKQAMAYICS